MAKKYVTVDWGGNPITTDGDGYILPRRAEMILNAKYYPTGTVGEWPCDPETGEKLEIDGPENRPSKNGTMKSIADWSYDVTNNPFYQGLFLGLGIGLVLSAFIIVTFQLSQVL